MDSHKQEIVEKLQSATNIMVTVNSNPTVDQLAACIGLTLLLNKLDKHATAVFSGNVPSTIEFLKPEATLEKNTDSLRDFIIALDKSKADKLRYKVEDKVVKIFITPYRTSLNAEDLNFSQGDFNIDIVVALGVHEQSELDQAITSHGRILHDATIACINNSKSGELGTLNWENLEASSLSELVVDLAKSFDKPLLDEQIATALLTGIVAETDRFRNDRTTASTMSLSAELMKAGANQQLVAKELDHEMELHSDRPQTPTPRLPQQQPSDNEPKQPKRDDGTLEIDHVKPTDQPPVLEEQSGEPEPEDKPTLPPAKPDEDGDDLEPPSHKTTRTLITEPPTLGGGLNSRAFPDDTSFDPEIDMRDPGQANPTMLRRPDGTPMDENEQPSGSPSSQFVASPAPTPVPPQPTPPQTPASQFFEPLPPADKPDTVPQQSPAFASAPTPQYSQPLPPAPTTPPAPAPAPKPPQQSTPLPTPQSSTQFQYPAPAPMPQQQAPAFASAPAPTPPPAQPPKPAAPTPPPITKPPVTTPSAPTSSPAKDLRDYSHETLTELEDTVHGKTPANDSVDDVEKARAEVLKAINEQSDTNLPPVSALNAQPLGGDLHPHEDDPFVPGGGQLGPANPPKPQAPNPLPPNAREAAPMSSSPADQPLTMPLPPTINMAPPQTQPPTNSQFNAPNSPPPVPPPMMPPGF